MRTFQKNHLTQALAARFLEISAILYSYVPLSAFAGYTESEREVLKTALKTCVLCDPQVTRLCVALLEEWGIDLKIESAYAMMHLPHDAREQGTWHRDGINHHVLWIPLMEYRYPALSVIGGSEGLLSRPILFLIRKLLPQFISQRLATRLSGNDGAYFWRARMVHKGNFNSSSHHTFAIQMVLRKELRDHMPLECFRNDKQMRIFICKMLSGHGFRVPEDKLTETMPDRAKHIFSHILTLRAPELKTVPV